MFQEHFKFTEEPVLNSESCEVEWMLPQEDMNSLSRLRPRNAISRFEIGIGIVYILFGKDFDGRWSEIGQTESRQILMTPGKYRGTFINRGFLFH